MKANNGQILTLILIALMLTISAERGETGNSPRIIQASEIMTKIAENKSINYNNVTIEGNINFDKGSSEIGKQIQVCIYVPSLSVGPNSSIEQVLNESEASNKTFIAQMSSSSLMISSQDFEANFPEPHYQNTSGLTTFMILRLPDPTFVNSQITIKDSVINGSLQFNNTTFQDIITFTNTTFSKDVYFIGSKFSKTANFEKAKFQNVSFCYANFSEQAKFKAANFNKLAFFPKARFNAKTDFEDVNFMGYADFFGAKFIEDKIVIENTSAIENASTPKRAEADTITAQSAIAQSDDDVFRSSIFLRAFNLPTTNGYTLMEAESKYFYPAATKSNITFDNSRFNDTANFVGAKFNHNASFEGCIFNKNTLFSGANFGEYAYFVRSNFGGDSDFLLANFTNETHFEDTTFLGYAKFHSAIFMKDVYFNNAHFLKYADFLNANFYGAFALDQTEFTTIKLENAAFWRSSNLSLDDSDLIKSSSSLLLVKWDSIRSHLVQSGSVYVALIKNFRNIGNYEDADNCYYEYRYWELRSWWQQNRSLSDGSKYIDILSMITCGYGVRWTHTLLSGVGILIFFGIIYLYRSKNNHVVRIGSIKRILESLSFSLIVLISAPNDFYPYGPKIFIKFAKQNKYLIILERLLGWTLMLLLIGTLSRVMIRY